MKYCISFFILTCFLFPCHSNGQTVVEIKNLSFRYDTAFYNQLPFTGKGVIIKQKTKLNPTTKKLKSDTVKWTELENEYAKGLMQKQTTYFSEGEKKLEIDYAKGKYQEWYNGALKSIQKLKVEGPLKNKDKDGEWTFYHKNGKVSAEGIYIKGLQDGKWTYYHSNGQKSAEGVYKNGTMEGTWTYWYKDGRVSSESQIQKLSPQQRKQQKKILEALLFPIYLMK